MLLECHFLTIIYFPYPFKTLDPSIKILKVVFYSSQLFSKTSSSPSINTPSPRINEFSATTTISPSINFFQLTCCSIPFQIAVHKIDSSILKFCVLGINYKKNCIRRRTPIIKFDINETDMSISWYIQRGSIYLTLSFRVYLI